MTTIDMRITFSAGVGDLANALCSAYRNHSTEFDGPLPTLSKTATIATIRGEFHHRGGAQGLEGWADYQSDKETQDWLAWAEAQVLRAYPGLADTEQQPEEVAEAPTEAAPVACVHGHTPRPDVTGDPVTACAQRYGNEEFGAFNPEGCFEARDCAVEVANFAAAEAETEDDITWGLICPEHPEWPKATCWECDAEPDGQDGGQV